MNQIKNLLLCVRCAVCISRRSNSVCVRFAPSPTGYLHLGGLRTALYNHLFALSKQGTTILRIEDTDQERKVAGAEEQLVEDLQWCGLKYDRGPFRQSDRLSLYKEHVERLISSGHAYRCFCPGTRLDILRREAIKSGQVPRYDNRCRHLTEKEIATKLENKVLHCVRFKLMPCSEPFQDLVYGEIVQDVASLEGDPVILKTDGFPTYHLANVVDDHDMGITHVLRGVEWQGSTKKHLLLYRAFGWHPPYFGHLPLLLNPDGTKLSKRQGDVHVRQFKDKGIFPLALINFVVRAGGGFDIEHAQMDLKSFTLDELASRFDLHRIKGSSCKVDLDKLKVSNQLELRRKLLNTGETNEVVSKVQGIVSSHFEKGDHQVDVSFNHISKILSWSQNRITNLEELISPQLRFLWVVPLSRSLQQKEREVVLSLLSRLDNCNFSTDELKALCKATAAEHNVKFPELMKILRSVLSGLKEGPGVVEIMTLLGKETILKRLQNSVGKSQQSVADGRS